MIDRIKLNSYAVELRHEWEMNSFSPINLLSAVLSRMPNLTILYYPMSENTSGMCIKDINGINLEDNSILENNSQDSIFYKKSSDFSLDYDSKISSDMIIGISSITSKGRQNFTLAHELYHLLFEESTNNFVICEYSSESDSEIEANIFASYLLIPYEGLERYVKSKNISQWTLDDIITAEQYYQISHHALLFRLVEQGFISEDESIEFRNVKISYEAKIRGFNEELYYTSPDDKKYYSLGKYVRSIEEAFKLNKISKGKKDELLLDGFRSDLTYGK